MKYYRAMCTWLKQSTANLTTDLTMTANAGDNVGMIRRNTNDGCLLIAQHDHAKLAGQLSQRLRFFDDLQDWELTQATIIAIFQHDAGWIETDQMGLLNSSHEPLHVFESPTLIALETWTRSVKLAETLHPYAALLISIHQMALSSMAINHAEKYSPQELFGINKFQHQQAERQEVLRTILGLRTDIPLAYGLAARGIDPREDLLRSHFRLLTFCDRVSLELCCGKTLFETIDEVPQQKNAKAIPVHTLMPDANRTLIHPWPFTTNEAISLSVETVQLPVRQFESETDFNRQYQESKRKPIQFHLQIGR